MKNRFQFFILVGLVLSFSQNSFAMKAKKRGIRFNEKTGEFIVRISERTNWPVEEVIKAIKDDDVEAFKQLMDNLNKKFLEMFNTLKKKLCLNDSEQRVLFIFRYNNDLFKTNPSDFDYDDRRKHEDYLVSFIHVALMLKSEKIVKFIFGEDKNACRDDRYYKYTDFLPIHCAAYGGFVNGIKLCIEAGSGVNAVDRICCYTPLEIASSKGHSAFCKVLIECDANVEFKLASSLGFAARNGHLKVCEVLIEKALDKFRGHLTFLKFLEGGSSMAEASLYGRHECVRCIINGFKKRFKRLEDLRIFVNSRVGYDTPLISSAYFGHYKVMKILRANGADPSLKNEKRYTALDVVLEKMNVVTTCSRSKEEEERDAEKYKDYGRCIDILRSSFYTLGRKITERVKKNPLLGANVIYHTLMFKK